MWSGQRETSAPPAALDNRREISAAWRSLNQSKAALRHIENRLEAVSGSGVVLDTLMTSEKTPVSGSRKANRRERTGVDDSSASKSRRSRNPETSSRSPLRNSTLDNSSERTHTQPSHREVSPPAPHRVYDQSDAVYDRDTRPVQTADLDSTHSSAIHNTTVRVLNDPPLLGSLGSPGSELRPGAVQEDGRAGVVSESSSPRSATLRLEKLRQRRTDGKLEKLKETIRRQREQLEETTERERIIHRLEQPLGIGVSHGTTGPTAKVRKVAPAPPAPVYKGFNTSETTIRTQDGRVWGEEEFQNFSRDVFIHHLTGRTQKPKEKEKVQERKPVKPVRKIHRSTSVPDPQTRPAISTSSWREGQKLVKMILGPSPRLPGEPRAQSAERERRTGAAPRSISDPRLELNRRSRPNSSERQAARNTRPAGGERGRNTAAKHTAIPAGGDRGRAAEVKQSSRSAGVPRSQSADLLSADIRGILDDLQLEGSTEGPEGGGANQRAEGRSRRAPIRSSHSASPSNPRPERKRQYDAEAVRQYIARQQEDRKRKQAEERRSQKEEEQKRSQRLQELYRRQRGGGARPQAPPSNPPRTHLQDTYTKLLLEHTLQQPRPVYQPSGESDKENKRQEPPSPSHSDLSVSEHGAPALSRAELDICPAHTSSSLVPSSGQLFSQLLAMERAIAAETSPQAVDLSSTHPLHTHPAHTVPTQPSRPNPRLSRVEALKASAVSLSSRIEREARKLAGGGINHGMPSASNDIDEGDGDSRWAKSLSPPVRGSPGGADEPALRIQRLLRAGQSAFEGTVDVPGVGNLYSFGTRERAEYTAKPRPSPPGPVHSFTKGAEPLDSSGGSISEGPLTDSSFSEPEDQTGDPPAVLQDVPKPSLRLSGLDYCASMQNGHTLDSLALFQREAAQSAPYRPGGELRDSRAPWDDLNKGSPHSVINIFTKSIHGYSKVLDVGGEGVSPVPPAAGSVSSSVNGVYEEDFVSSRSSSRSASRRTDCSLSNGHSAAVTDDRRENKKFLKFSTASPLSSPQSTQSSSKRGSERSLDRPLVDGQRSVLSAASEPQWNGVKHSPNGVKTPPSSSPHGSPRSTDSAAGGASVLSLHSLASEGHPSPRGLTVSPGSPNASPRVSPPSGSSHTDPRPASSSPRPSANRNTAPNADLNAAPDIGPAPETGHSREFRSAAPTDPRFAPGVLQQRLSAELCFLDAVEESVRQLGDVERVRAVSLAQQESVSLAQILKAQQQRQERELHLLKLKAEQEALETQRQLQENRERAAQAHADLCVSLVQSQQQALLGLQESSSKIITQQAETAQHTAAAARHIKEMTELARSQMQNVPSVTPVYDPQRQPRPQTDSHSETPLSGVQSPTAETPPDSLSESVPSRRPTISGGGSSVRLSPSLSSSVREEVVDGGCRERSSSVEEEVHTGAEESLQTDSIHSLLEDRADNASVVTEYSLKFEESVTEDELEKSFRSLLPSESHWRDSVERNRSPVPESDEDHSRKKSSPQLSNKDGGRLFSSGQDNFSRFTMAMVRQYMQEEEVRAQHQSSLLRLRHRALKEKTKAELAWLEHQKRRLRDKGEDDKMPPIRKRQRGLLLKLQQEQAEIRRLQEANRAARRERQLLLKQQEEIERIHHSTLKLKEKLRSAGDNSPGSPASGEVKEAEPNLGTETETRSPSPLSVSGSETSSIMQKLKKMRIHMDERFLTEREQGLVRRRLKVEELLQWRKRLDAEEVEVRRMEKQALAALEQQTQSQQKRTPNSTQSKSSATHRPGRGTGTGREAVSEGDSSPVSSVHSAVWVSEQPLSPSSETAASKPPSTQSSEPHTHTLTHSAQPPGSHGHGDSSNYSSSSKLEVHTSRSNEPRLSAPTSEAASDQSDVEGRVLALKEELRRRKAEVQRLKKAQKQRHKERLKAQEASLLKQLESYNNFIEKTKAELSKEADGSPAAKPQIKTPASGSENKARIRAPTVHRPEVEKTLQTFSRSEEKSLSEAESAGQSEPTEDQEIISSDEDPPTVTPTPVFGSPERASTSLQSPESQHSPNDTATKPQLDVSADQSVVSSPKSEVVEELDSLKSEGSGDEHDSHPLLQLDLQLPSRRAEEIQPDLSGKISNNEAEEKPGSEDSRAEDVKSPSLPQQPLITEEPQAPTEKSPSSMDESYSPDFSPRRNDPDQHKHTPSPPGDGYNDDFESSLGSSFREEKQESSPGDLVHKSFSSEEEIDEELSVKSGITSDSFHPERPLGLDFLEKPFRDSFNEEVSPSALPQDDMPGYCIGDRVLVSNVQPGTLKFKGQTSFANGFWAGVELDISEGSNDGTYDGVTYFQCKKGHGIFAPPDKVTHLPEKFESYVDTTEDEDSTLDDQPNKDVSDGDSKKSTERNNNSETDFQSGTRDTSSKGFGKDSKDDLDGTVQDILEDFHGGKLPVPNIGSRDIILEFEDMSNGETTLPSDVHDRAGSDLLQEPALDILDLLVIGEKSRIEGLQESSGLATENKTRLERIDGEVNETKTLGSLADKLLDSFMSDAVRQFQEIKKTKDKKISAANQQIDAFLGEDEERLENDFNAYFDQDQEEASSPELCNRSESPVLGPRGQEELAKRLAELELSRELLDALGDEQDWFDEDFGLSSRKEQEKLKQLQEGTAPKAPARPQLPRQKTPEEPQMLVPHTAPEVEKLVGAALLEIWTHCGLGDGLQSLGRVRRPQPSEAFLGTGGTNDEQEAECNRSYKQAVFDLSWEVVQDVFMEDPNADQPQWVKPRRAASSYIHRVHSPSDVTKVQAFVTAEVLKLFGLKKDPNYKTDWQKMLKFGRKKRDRVDHILVQELHEEEALWVNYDEDELFVKMQLADGIFDALLKDTGEILVQIQEKRSRRKI